MESEGVSLPLIHEHLMVPRNSLEKGDCCGRFEAITDGFYCEICKFFVHKKCSESSESIRHPSHSIHTLKLRRNPNDNRCSLCLRGIVNLFYRCEICDFHIDLHCVWQPPVKHPLEVNHSYHYWHPLKLFTSRLPDYSDGKCRLCERKVDDRLFYHCSSCNFTLDMRCVLHPPPHSLLDLKVHDHQLTLLPRLRSFTCNACGLSGDRSPYICVQCDFMIHQDCLTLPRVININRHEHRISRTSVLGVVNSVCGVCRKKVDWTCGGYSCQKCPSYVVHSKCATRKDVWNGKELEGVPEEIEDIEPYVVIDENTINHCSHKEHNLRLHVNGVMYEESKWCSACSHPIGLQSFYGCLDCDFVLHQNCAKLPKKKWHVLHNDRLTLLASKAEFFMCDACLRISNGFAYREGRMELDVWCCSISEPFVHPSHPHHPLYYIPRNKDEICNGCNQEETHVLRCIEDDCEFVLGFNCATLPQVVKHRVDDHPLSLCYGEEGTSGKYWCDICEKESDPSKWFYTCKDQRACLHTECVLGDLSGLMPRSTIKYFGTSYEVVLNDSISRPFCRECKSHCIYPVILKKLGTSDTYFCSMRCLGCTEILTNEDLYRAKWSNNNMK